MADNPGFGVLLTRLLTCRQTDIVWLAAASGIPECELRAVTEGASPSPSQLDDLAAALGFHTADLFVIAGLSVPEPLQPCEPATGHELSPLIEVTMALPADQRTHIRETAEQLPRLPHIRPADPPRTYNKGDGGYGEMLVTLLCANRNLHSPSAAARILGVLGGVVLAAATINSLRGGRVPLKPIWLVGFATTLGIPATDLAAITGIDISGIGVCEAARPDDLLPAEMAELLWTCRQLSVSQVKRVRTEAEAMLVEVPDNASSDNWNRVYRHYDGTWWGAPRRYPQTEGVFWGAWPSPRPSATTPRCDSLCSDMTPDTTRKISVKPTS
jgi:hypothetical protein